MGLEEAIYYIIDTPIVDGSSVYTYNLSPTTGSSYTNTLSSSGTSTVYYADIVTTSTFNTSGYSSSSSVITGIPTTVYSYIPAASSSNNYILSAKPFTIYEISKMITVMINSFTSDIIQVNACIKSAEKGQNNSLCNDTYQQPISSTQLPLYQYSVMNTTTRRKHLQQQSNDLNNLINTYSTIVNQLVTTNTADMSNNIFIQYNENLKLRNELDKRLGEIYKYNDSMYKQSEYNLDRIVYSEVLLTILATSLIYIVFTRL